MSSELPRAAALDALSLAWSALGHGTEAAGIGFLALGSSKNLQGTFRKGKRRSQT